MYIALPTNLQYAFVYTYTMTWNFTRASLQQYKLLPEVYIDIKQSSVSVS